MSRNMCQLCHKVLNNQNLPLESPNYINFFSSYKFYGQFKPLFYKSEITSQKQFCSKQFFFLLSTSVCQGTCLLGVTNWVMPKQALVQLLHGQMKLDVSTTSKVTFLKTNDKCRSLSLPDYRSSRDICVLGKNNAFIYWFNGKLCELILYNCFSDHLKLNYANKLLKI